MDPTHSVSESPESADQRPLGTLIEAVRSSSTDRRQWLSEAPVVAALEALGIAHTGLISAPAPYRILRSTLPNAYFIATVSGVGRVFLEGEWRECPPGHAVLLMPGVLNAFESLPGVPWQHCWVRMRAHSKVSLGPIDRMQIVSPWNPAPLRHAILGLREAALNHSAPALLEKWADLVLQSVVAFSQKTDADPRLVRLWDAVSENLARPWTLEEMSRVAALSPEHVRRLSKSATGRSPRSQLTALRMQRATQLLGNPALSLGQIAEAVGYASPFAFSTAFKKTVGYSPSTYTGRNPVQGCPF
jgi:AraC-like DNA-binding protein